ncbi:centrosomal protein dilatory isoform X2 [Lasioglossum baleicum]|uniref:centrosomal protein dilatory isoform X2 n=1 Tax=Lasioglossum baleicum TaxID=434251 RepID=UPI003FCE6A09
MHRKSKDLSWSLRRMTPVQKALAGPPTRTSCPSWRSLKRVAEQYSSLDETKANVPEVDPEMLQEIFVKSQTLNYSNCNGVVPMGIANPAFEEDLATARLQLEEKDATIKLLKEQLRSDRKLVCEKLESQRKSTATKLHAQEDKYKAIVKRHQKFIEQLIDEKTELTEKCTSLAQRVKDVEVKMQRDLKTSAERHSVELQRAKEHFAAAEKIKRERWIEARTSKIKEMTVKGLEPELRSMMEQHAEEIQGLRNAHMKELQDVELRVIRRSNQQLEQLRLELTASHERMVANEKNILWTRYKEKIEEQESQFKVQQVKLMEELQTEKEKFNKDLTKQNTEWEVKLQRMHQQYQGELQAQKQQHLNEKKALQESLKSEWEAWIADYKKQQTLKLQRAENSIRDECNRERDRQIELAIERLEKNSRETKVTLQQQFDCKLGSLKEKFDVDLQAAVDSELLHKAQLMQAQDKVERTEVLLQKTERKLQECTNELKRANERAKRLSSERDDAKKLARQEIEGEKRDLEGKIASLYQEIALINANRDASLAQLHSRIKLIMTQKVLTIKNLTRELGNVKLKCEHLEKLLDQQRREYILKSV